MTDADVTSPACIDSEQELRALHAAPSDLVKRKCVDRLDRHCRGFIALSPFLVLGRPRGRVGPGGVDEVEHQADQQQRGHGEPTAQLGAAGEIVWLLESVGEGYVRVWRDGMVFDVDSPESWSDPVGAPVDDDFHWWVRVRTKPGVVGWFDNTHDLFMGFDGCG